MKNASGIFGPCVTVRASKSDFAAIFGVWVDSCDDDEDGTNNKNRCTCRTHQSLAVSRTHTASINRFHDCQFVGQRVK